MFRFLAPLLVVLLVTLPALAAPKAELWPRWQHNDPSSTEVVDHRGWARFLASYVRPGADGVNRVVYATVDPAGRAGLDRYLAAMAQAAVSRLNRAEQMAYWINLYNALTVHLVLEHYPVASIRDIDISPGLLSNGPWGAKLVTVEGQELALDDIEHRVLRPIWRDPRITRSTAPPAAAPTCGPRPTPRRRSTATWTRRPWPTSTIRGGRGWKATGCTSPASTSGSNTISAATMPATSATLWPTPFRPWRCACRHWTALPAMGTTGR
jgi:hypothetical protein